MLYPAELRARDGFPDIRLAGKVYPMGCRRRPQFAAAGSQPNSALGARAAAVVVANRASPSTAFFPSGAGSCAMSNEAGEPGQSVTAATPGTRDRVHGLLIVPCTDWTLGRRQAWAFIKFERG